MNEDHIKEIFSTFGLVKSVELAIDRVVNLPRGFAYVEYEERADAEKARMSMDGGQLDGNYLRFACAHIHAHPPNEPSTMIGPQPLHMTSALEAEI